MAALSKYITQDGTAGQFLAGGSVANFARTDAFSVSGWIRLNADGVAEQYLWGSSLNAVGNERGWQITHVDSGVAPPAPGANDGLRFILANDIVTDRLIVTSRYLAAGIWYFIVLTYDGSGTGAGVEFYVNGQIAEKPVVVSPVAGTTDDPAAVFQIGDGLGSASPAQVSYRSCQLWNKALAAAEVLELWNNEVPVDPTTVSFAGNLIDAWDMDPDGNWPSVPSLTGGTDLTGTGAWAAADPSERVSPPDHIGARFAWNKTDITQWTATGLTLGFVGGPLAQMNVTAPSGTFLEYVLADNEYTCPDHWSIICDFVVGTGAIGGVGFMPDELDDDGSFIDKVGGAFLYNQSNGRVSIHLAQRSLLDATPSRAASTGATPSSPGDVIRLVAIRAGNIMTVSAYNLTSGATANPPATAVHYATQSIVSGAWDEPPATAKPTIFLLAGGIGIQAYNVYNKDIANPCCLFLGDSITQGVAVGGSVASNLQRWVEQAQVNMAADLPSVGGSIATSAGGGDRIASGEVKITSGDIASYGAEHIFTPLGGNDMNRIGSFGVTLADVENAHGTLVTNLLAVPGVKSVVILNISPLNGDANVPLFNAYLAGQPQTVVDIYSALVGVPTFLDPPYDSGDGTHLNVAGMTQYADTTRTTVAEVCAQAGFFWVPLGTFGPGGIKGFLGAMRSLPLGVGVRPSFIGTKRGPT